MRTIEPLSDRLLVEPWTREKHYARLHNRTPIVIPDIALYEHPDEGRVVAVGPAVRDYVVGDVVIWRQHAESRLGEPYNGAARPCVMVDESEVLGLLVE